MKIFFQASPRALPQYKDQIFRAYTLLEDLGHQHLNDFIVTSAAQNFYSSSEEELQKIYEEVMSEMQKADVIILDISIHSLTMGYYVKAALDLHKSVIILHAPEQKPIFFSGIQNDRLQIVEYTTTNLLEVLKTCLVYAQEKSDIRFNLYLSPELNTYLKWAAQESDTQKSNFVRELILKHKEKNNKKYLEAQKK